MQITTYNSGVAAGINGIHKASAGIDKAAQQIVQKTFSESGSNGIIEDYAALKKNVLMFEASGKVIKTANDSAGRIIDILI